MSAAVPAPATIILGPILWSLSQLFYATIDPIVDLLSAHKITPSLKMSPAIVVPVFVMLGVRPLLMSYWLRIDNEKSSPGWCFW